MEEQRLAAPATFQHPGCTFHRGDQSRTIDWILVSANLLPDVLDTFVYPAEVFALGERLDHKPTGIRMNIKGKEIRQRAEPWASTRLLQLPSSQEDVQGYWSQVPPLPAYWPSTLMETAVAIKARQIFATACPPGRAAPRADWIDEEAWVAIKAVATKRVDFFRKQRLQYIEVQNTSLGAGAPLPVRPLSSQTTHLFYE